ATAYICAMDDRAQMLGDYLITGVQIRLQQHSRELYGQSKLDVPAPIQTLHLAELMTPPDDSIKFFEAKGRELLRQVGLGDLVGNTAGGSKERRAPRRVGAARRRGGPRDRRAGPRPGVCELTFSLDRQTGALVHRWKRVKGRFITDEECARYLLIR